MINRRDILKLAAAGGAVGALGAIAGCERPQSGGAAPGESPEASAAAPGPATSPDPSIGVRRADDRGTSDRGWLKARFSFSFSDYADPRWSSFGPLRVINEDRIASQGGFPLHPHRNMEIITYVLKGALEHKDTLGNSGTIEPGQVQYMSAGQGVRHSEFNTSSDTTHLYQIWLTPSQDGGAPAYGSRHFGDERHGGLRLIASPAGREGSIAIRQDADLHAAILKPGDEILHALAPGRRFWLQVARGALRLNGHHLLTGDGAFSIDTPGLEIQALEGCELLLFDMA